MKHPLLKKLTLMIITLLWLAKCFASDQLLFAVDLIRHGDRTPEKAIPAAPYAWEEGLGELTTKGMQQEYQLGMALRKKYIDEYHLLPKRYHQEIIFVRSTDMNRTLMSAQSFLFGLYPLGTGGLLPAEFQPIPIHTVPTRQDKLLLVNFKQNIHSLIALYFLSHQAWKEKLPLFKDKLPKWEAATGMQIKSFVQLSHLADNLYIRKLKQIPLPQGISQQDADEIITLGRDAFLQAFKQKALTYPMGHAFLAALIPYMKSAVNHTTSLKYILFSAHDSSIMAVMNTLGAPLAEVPPYASHLNFSLWKNKQGYYVTISFNDKPVKIAACGGTVCSLQQFYKLAG